MVSAKLSRVRVRGRRKLAIGLALAAPVALISACGKLVGIEDTVVASGGAGQSGSGGASGGTKATGGTSGASGGSTSSGGSIATGGASSGTGGKAAQGGAATTGGSSGVPEGGDSSAGEAGMGPGGTGPTGGASSGGASGAAGKAGTGGVSGGAGGKANTGGTSGGTAGKAGTGGATGGTAGGTSTGGAGGSAGCNPACPLDKPACEAGQCVQRGPTMVKVNTTPPFYVDSTEVTVAQYQAFLAAKGTNTSGQPAVCSWNTSYYDTSNPMNADNFPISNVDWCDATAFCAWSGKHLCGKIGGGPIARADLFTANTHQWYLACGGPSNGTHPNNNPMCNSGTGTVAAVGTYPGCIGYYAGLYDMEGNVAEWVDGCATNTGKDDICYLMGGGIFDNTKSYCTEVYEDVKRGDVAVSFGFRCCSG